MRSVFEHVRERIREDLEAIPAIDHHAHLLCREEGPFVLGDDVAPLSELVIESVDPKAAAGHVREHPSYHRAIRDLARLLDVPPNEAEVARAREAEGYAAYTRRLIEAAGLAAMFVDDGIGGFDLLSAVDQAALVGVPNRRVLRVEAVLQDLAAGWPEFDRVHGVVRRSGRGSARRRSGRAEDDRRLQVRARPACARPG